MKINGSLGLFSKLVIEKNINKWKEKTAEKCNNFKFDSRNNKKPRKQEEPKNFY